MKLLQLRLVLITVIAFALIWQGGCVILMRQVKVGELNPEHPPPSVRAGLRVHTTDGSVLILANGARFSADSLFGLGYLYGMRPERTPEPVTSFPLDRVAAVEYLTEEINAPISIGISLLATAASVVGSTALFVAIFGSCPTLYAPADSSARLEAEVFSNSIVPLFEMRDVDRLALQADGDGRVTLELRNEALETHYLNHLELLEVQHRVDEVAVNDMLGQIHLIRDLKPPSRARDRSGRNVTSLLEAADARIFATEEDRLAHANLDDFRDGIELVFPPVEADSAALFFRLRNSLLSTVILYDYMLDAQGVNAINWMTETLNTIGGAVKVGQFYQKNMGLRVQVWNGESYVEQERLSHVGPIAWDEVAVPFPILTRDSVRVRLDFVTDAWRIDQVSLAGGVRPGQARAWPLDRVRGADQGDRSDLVEQMRMPDTSYAVTFPGNRYTLDFSPGPSVSPRTFFVAAQGYYIEWIRGSWIRDDVAGQPLAPSDTLLVDALQHWQTVKNDFERRFFESKVPVR